MPQTKSRIANDMKAKYLLQVPRESKGRERERVRETDGQTNRQAEVEIELYLNTMKAVCILMHEKK